jgi:hypothetical protein
VQKYALPKQEQNRVPLEHKSDAEMFDASPAVTVSSCEVGQMESRQKLKSTDQLNSSTTTYEGS